MVSFSRSAQVAADQPEGAVVAAPNAAGAAAFPRVNLMPDAIAAEARAHRAKVVLVGTTVASVAVIAGLYVVAAASVSSAQDDLGSAQAQAASLSAEAAKYADVPKVQAQVQSAMAQQYQALGGEVRWSFLLNNLALTIPPGTALISLDGSVSPTPPSSTTGGASTAPSTPGAAKVPGSTAGSYVSVLGRQGIGTINYQGEATGYPQVANFLDSQAKQATLLDPYATAAGRPKDPNKPGFQWTSSVTISAAALSHRYDLKAGS